MTVYGMDSNDAENLAFFSCFRRTESPTHMSELFVCRLLSPYSFHFLFSEGIIPLRFSVFFGSRFFSYTW